MKINLLKVVFPLQPSTFGLIVYPIPIRKKVSFKYKSTCEKTVSLHRCSLEVAHPDRVMDSRLFVKVPLNKLIGEVYWAGILGKKRESKCSWGLCNKKQRYERPLNRLTVNFRVCHTHSEKLALFTPARPQ